MQQDTTHKQSFAWSLLILLALTWGSSYILMKKALQVFSSQEFYGKVKSFLPFFVLLLSVISSTFSKISFHFFAMRTSSGKK